MASIVSSLIIVLLVILYLYSLATGKLTEHPSDMAVSYFIPNITTGISILIPFLAIRYIIGNIPIKDPMKDTENYKKFMEIVVEKIRGNRKEKIVLVEGIIAAVASLLLMVAIIAMAFIANWTSGRI
jgi:hypothetical protein